MGQEHRPWVPTSLNETAAHHFQSMPCQQVVELLEEVFRVCQAEMIRPTAQCGVVHFNAIIHESTWQAFNKCYPKTSQSYPTEINFLREKYYIFYV